MAASSPPPPNWADLHEDALMMVFERLSTGDLLMGASVVCRSWLRLATGEPRLWRRVDLTDCFDPTIDMCAMARAAVDRAAGRLEHFAADRFATDALLEYIAERTSYLKSLRLLKCMDLSFIGLVTLGIGNPDLEELELTCCLPLHSIFRVPMELVGQACPHLKRLRLNSRWFDIELEEVIDNYQARGIATYMPELQDLQLFANRLHNNALYDILDKCPHLESLDLRQCFNIEVDAELEAKCSKLNNVRFPKDSTKDYKHETFIETFSSGTLSFVAPPRFPYYGFHDRDEEDDRDTDEDSEDDNEDYGDSEDDNDSD